MIINFINKKKLTAAIILENDNYRVVTCDYNELYNNILEAIRYLNNNGYELATKEL